MTEKELLEKAAKAAGIELRWVEDKDEPWCFIPSAKPPHNRRKSDANLGEIWNPLTDDGDALRLAVKLRLDVLQLLPCGVEARRSFALRTTATSNYVSYAEADPYVATRRAIVRAAAAIGETP